MKIEKLCIFLLFASISPLAISLPCSEPPEAQVETVFRTLENRGRDQAVVENLYNREFSSEFKRNFSFPQFYLQLQDVQKSLRIGVSENRTWESRGLGSGAALVEPIGGSIPAYHVQFLTTSPVGKIGQRAYVICEREQWKLTGIWYFPLANAGSLQGSKGIPRYCCTAAGRLGPFANPDIKTGRPIPEGGACYVNASPGQTLIGTACY